MNAGMYDSFFMDNLWNGIPCSDLLALADAAITTKGSAGGGGGGGGGNGGGENEAHMHFEKPDSQQCKHDQAITSNKDEQPGRTRYLFDLNSLPTVTEPQLITGISSQLTPITPKQTGRAGHREVVSEIINLDGDGRTDEAADKQDDERFNLEQPQLIIEQSQDANSMQLEDFDEGSSDDFNLKKTPQPKQRRRKHRPKVVIEGQRKTAKKPTPPKPNGSSTGKRKYVRKIASEKSTPTTEGTSEATDLTAVRQTRNSCRRKINFEEEQNLHTGVRSVVQPGQGTEKKTQIELKYDKAFATNQVTMLESQSLSPITPNKSELKHERLAKDAEQTCSRAKRNINFSRKAHDKDAGTVLSRNDSNCSTSSCFNEGRETRGSKRECSGNETELGRRCESLEAYLSMITNSNNNGIPGLHFPAIYKKKRTEKCHSSVTSRAVSSVWSPDDNNCSFPGVRYAIEAPETSRVYGANNQQSYKNTLAFGHVESFRKKRTKGQKRVRDLASFAGMIEGKQWPAHNRASARKASCKYHTCMEALAADFSVSIATKKRTKRNAIVPSSSYYNHSLLNNHTGFRPSLRWRSTYDFNALINQFESLSINKRMVEQDRHALVPYSTRYQEKNAVVLYQDKSLVPFEGSYNPMRRRKPRPKVDLDDETTRVWRLLLEDINSKGIDGTDEEKEKWWEEERNVFRGRATSFIARMHLVQGDRRFSQWKGSVVDSVIGVFLTQNVSDHLSSSAFMSLAARYPLKSKSSNEPLQDDKSSIFVKETCHLDVEETIRWHEENSNKKPAQDHGSMMLRNADSYEEKEVVNSNELCKISHASVALKDILGSEVLDDLVSSHNSVDTCPNSVQSSIADTGERLGSWLVSDSRAELMGASKPSICDRFTSFASTMLHEVYSQEQAHESSNKRIGKDKLESIGNSRERNEGISHNHTTSGFGIPPKDHDWQTAHGSGALEAEYLELREERTIMHKKPEVKCASEQSRISAESTSQATVELVRTRSFQEALGSCNTLQSEGQEIFDCLTMSENSKIVTNQQNVLRIENFSAEISEVTESNNIVEDSRETAHKIVESNSNEHGNLQTTASGINKGSAEVKKGKTGKAKQIKADWDSLRKRAQVNRKRERTPNTMDSLDYEAVRCADVHEIADTIKDRGMNNMLAERIKDFLNRLVRDHGSIDLEWLRDVPPDKAKEYLLSFRGLGLKSVECVRLLTLHHLAFPVDTNVGRIAVRLGWVPLQPLPESLQLHLLELYPVLESIQKYLWPRLCKLDQRTLYELHYQMITFGKVFCTKNKPNCNACPMRGECRHFASAFTSARLALPAPEEKSIVSATENKTPDHSPTGITNQHHLTLPLANQYLQQQSEVQNHDPVIEEPATPEPIVEVPATPEPEMIQQEFDIEDFCEDPEEIPMIRLNMEAFTQNLQTYMENNMELAEGDMSRALVALTSEAASIPTPKLKNVSQLRTEHQVYELPDSHPLLEGLDKREPDDPCSYLLAIWTPGETAESIQPPEGKCSSQESGMLCHKETCFLCNSIREANSQTVRGTLLIPCRTAMRGSFPLNGTYFQVNEVFADHDSSLNPIDVPRSWLWTLPRRTVYFGTSIPTIFKGLTTEGIQYCFWRGFVCVRGFDQKTRSPRPLMARLHFPASKLKRSRGKADEN